jgi:hypothetical protein
MVDVLERKILRRIYDPIRDRDQWRCRFNKELYGLFKEPRLFVVMRIARLRWAGHVARMDEECMSRRLMYVQPEGLRKVEDRVIGGEIMWDRTKDAGIKELVGNSHESRRVEETSEGGQDSTCCATADDDDICMEYSTNVIVNRTKSDTNILR